MVVRMHTHNRPSSAHSHNIVCSTQCTDKCMYSVVIRLIDTRAFRSVPLCTQIWDLSDPNGAGYLDKTGFFVAMKLVALAQNLGMDMNMANILTETPNPPKLGDLPKLSASSIQAVPPQANADWTIKVTDRLQYEELFESLKPVQDMLPGGKVKGVLMESKLPVDILGRIWELADQDKDGNLDKHEFVVAMHLVYQALAKRAIPLVLPPELQNKKHQQHHNNSILSNNINNNNANNTLVDDDSGFIANFPAELAPPPPVPPLPGNFFNFNLTQNF